MDEPSIKKRLIDFGTDEHEYDEVPEIPEESNNQQQQPQSPTTTTTTTEPIAKSNNNNTDDLPPELPPPKQKGVKNSKNKQKQQKSATKSKIPRSPSLASSLSSLASTFGGGGGSGSGSGNSTSNNNNNNSNVPPQTPPLPACYQQQNKAKHLNGSGVAVAGTPTTPTSNNGSKSKTNNNNSNNNNININNVNNLSGISNNNNNNSNIIMGGGVQLSQQQQAAAAAASAAAGATEMRGTTTANGQQQQQQQRSSLNLSITSGSRRPQIQITSIAESPTSPTSLATSPQKHFQYLTLTVRKDENGYGMKVSGDNPVFVESVKPGGAAQIAGLVAGDMILKVNGQEVRSEKHPTVVSLIKASTIVELAVKRNHKVTRPTSVGIVPSTPILSGRDRTASITGPQPVDSIKRREMETYKIQTLQKMLEEEKLNLEKLKGDTNNPSYKLSEANIRKLREQLRQVGAEDAPTIKYQSTANNNKNSAMLSPNQIQHLSASSSNSNTHHNQQQQQQQQLFHLHHLHHHNNHHNHHQQQHHHHQQATTPQPQPVHSSPAFLSLLPRSLSSLSLGTRKNKIDKDFITTPINNHNTTTDFLQKNQQSNATTTTSMSQSLHQATSQLQLQRLLRNSPPPQYYPQQQQQQQQQQQSGKDAKTTATTTSSSSTPLSSKSSSKNKFMVSKSLIEEDIPPPLPQRNPPRQFALDLNNGNLNSSGANNGNNSVNNNCNQLFAPISDLDRAASPQRHSPQCPQLPATPNSTPPSKQAASASKSKRSKTKTKALSDPKMSTQMFLQMETVTGGSGSGAGGCLSGMGTEVDSVPPPLPPRQPGMLDELSHHRGSCQNLNIGGGRPPPNSINTVFNYPLVSTCTAVQNDNMAAAFPLSQRPNIVQQLQQHQQQQQQQQQQHQQLQQQQQHQSGGQVQGTGSAVLGQTPHNLSHMKHRRVGSSPENMHPRHPERLAKSTSGSWELVEKDGEVTPPGTPPPPYLITSNMSVPEESNESGGIFVESQHFTPLAGAASPQPGAAILHSSRIQAAHSCDTQKEIISMEDESTSDQEEQFIDENGPFNNLTRLLESENVAFLAVFLNYVLSNSEPAPLLFYLITELYKEGTAKDMRKWAYEIHSTFLVPRAPLSWYRQDESLAREVDNVLQSEFDKVEILRTVFLRSRKRAKDIITEQLRDFQQKRTAGLGTIYGPTDAQLSEAKGDKQREHIIDETLMRKLQVFIEDYEKDLPTEDPRKLALCSALSTVIHRIFITRSHPNSIVDRVHHFVSREKSFKSRLMGKTRKMVVRGHSLVLRQYYEVTHCNHCQTIIWGVSPQGYHCTDCKLNIHRPCSKVLDENCPGPLPQAKRNQHNDNKISKFMGKIRPRTSSDFIAMERRARHEEDFDSDFIIERLQSSSITRQPSDRRPDANISQRSNGNASANSSALNSSDLQSSFHGASANDSASASIADTSASGGGVGGMLPATNAGPLSAVSGSGADTPEAAAVDSKDARRERYHQHPQHKSAPVSVNRSESYKERLSNKRNRNSRRKTSDPSLTSRPNDDQPDLGLSNSNYTASSNSSLSSGGGSESPSTSMEQVAGGAAATSAAAAASGSGSAAGTAAWHAHHTHQHSHQDSFHGSVGSASSNNTSFWGGQPIRQCVIDSDEEDDLNEADWSSMVAADMLAALTDAEKKRQEIINEIYQTERSHVRTLKLLDRLFFCPLYDSGYLTQDHLMLLFPPALHSLRDLHSNFEQKLKLRRVEHNHIVTHIGDLLAGMFDGQPGEELREYAAQFCARQQIALEALKEKRRKDEQLQKLLCKSESHKACRRLQLKDLLPTVLQRLTKYPLLFENLYKVTIRVVPENTTEAEAIQRALESSKKILVEVNQAVKTAEDAHKLQNIQLKLDKSTVDKVEFKNLDLTQYRLIHDGNLTMKKNQNIQLHGLLFENMIVLLTKQDDKYSLKYLHVPLVVSNKPISPIMSIDSETLVRQEAADKNSFFLIKTRTSQMLELRAPSSSECKTWFKHISDAAEQYKPRSKSNTSNQEPVDDPAIATIPHSNTKESLEPTPERPPPMSATATVTTTPLAPMLPVATVTPPAGMTGTTANNNNYNDVQLRNGRRESTPVTSDNGGYYNLGKQRLSHNELSSSSAGGSSLAAGVNRTMSTRSCGEANNNYAAGGGEINGVTLRHTQSARQANGQSGNNADYAQDPLQHNSAYSLVGGPSKRDSASIVCSNNSNNTRTLLMQSPLVEPTAIQISISPAHTAEPVLTPSEKLRRLDASIRDGLLEKQKIICDMFRLPVEHFNEIVDIAAMPEAPKDSADIALAAYDQVQTLTKVLNEYMQVTPEQEISAVSTAVCDHCHEQQQRKSANTAATTPAAAAAATSASSSSTSTSSSANTSSSVSNSTATQIAARADTPPPPLPPPNKQPAQQQTPAKNMPKLQTPMLDEQSINIHEDDDGYCEIDELRLPALPPLTKPAAAAPTPPLATFKVPMVPGTPTTTPATPPAASTPTTTATTAVTSTTPELIKRQSTISADSIPEESADEVSKALDDGEQQSSAAAAAAAADVPKSDVVSTPATQDSQSAENDATAAKPDESKAEKQTDDTQKTSECEVQSVEETAADSTTTSVAEPQRPKSAAASPSDEELTELDSEFIEINDVYTTLAALNKAQATLSMIDNSTQTVQPLTLSIAAGNGGTPLTNGTKLAGHKTTPGTCGPNRIQHANALEPSVPCYALSNIVSVLNEQISLLLPKISERDMERERLRKENQHLRELLSAMHERQRVESKGETPTDIKTILSAADEAFDDEIDGASNTSVTPTPTPLPTTPTASPTVADAVDSTIPTTPTTTTKSSIEAEN